MTEKTKGRGHQTQWAAQFAVASELCKRGYEVSFTMGNATPLADLMIVSPKRKQMSLIDVKGLYSRNPWLLRRKAQRDDLYYVLAYVPPAPAQNQFFVLTQAEANQLVEDELKRLRRKVGYPVEGFLWKLALPFENAWHKLPE